MFRIPSLRAVMAGEPKPSLRIRGEASWHSDSFRMLTLDGRDQVVSAVSAHGWHAYEAPTPRCFASAVAAAPRPVVVDIGANTGFYTLLALAVASRTRVYAYEPFSTVRATLTANIALNRAGRRAVVREQAVSESGGTRSLHIPDQGHGLVETSASLSASFKGDCVRSIPVRTVALDEETFGGRRVTVIKVDAESHDLQVLRGARRLLRRDRPLVFLEVLLGADEAGLTALLRECGYLDCVLREDGATDPGDTVRHDPAAWNHLWIPRECPAEAVAQLTADARACR